MHRIKVYDNFVSPEEIKIFMDIFDTDKEKFVLYGSTFSMYILGFGQDNFDSSPFFNSPNTISGILPDYAEFLKEYHKRVEAVAQSDSSKESFWSVSWLVKTVKGGLHPHGDNVPESIYQYDHTCILYLNECEDGGDIFFPDYNYSFSPKPGSLISFPADYNHGVVPTPTDRYAVPSWFTKDTRYALLDSM